MALKKKAKSAVLCSLCGKRESESATLFQYPYLLNRNEIQYGYSYQNEIQVCSLCQTIRWGESKVCVRCRNGQWKHDRKSNQYRRYGSIFVGLWDGACLPERKCGRESDYDDIDEEAPPPLGLEERWSIERPAAVFEMWRRGVQFFRQGQDFDLVNTDIINSGLVGQYIVYWAKYLGEGQSELHIPDQEMERSVFGRLELWKNEEAGDEDVYDGALRFPDSDFMGALSDSTLSDGPNCRLLRIQDNGGTWMQGILPFDEEDEIPVLEVSKINQEAFLEWSPCESAPTQGDYCSALKTSSESLEQRLDQRCSSGSAAAGPSSWIAKHLGFPQELANTILRFIVMLPPKRFLKVNKGDLLLRIVMDYLDDHEGPTVRVHLLARKIEEAVVP